VTTVVNGERDPAPPTDTITLGQYQRREHPAANGNAVEGRICVACGKPLAPRQQRACSQACARSLGATARHREATARRPRPRASTTDPLAFLDQLPPCVVSVGIAHGGWEVTAKRG